LKIIQFKTTVVAVPQHRAYKSSWRRRYQGRSAQCSVLVELLTDDGLSGIGESPVVYAAHPEVTVALLQGVSDLVVGADPLEHDILRRTIYAETGMAHLGTQGLSWALAGLDTAIWDLVGKIFGQPLHLVWGSAWRSRSPFYADIPPASPGEMAEEAVEWVKKGFETIYFKVGFDPTLDISRMAAIRGAVGEPVRIRVDANQAWSPGAARRIIGAMAEFKPEYIEQPVLASNLDEMAAVRRSVTVPILAHEASLSVEGSLAVIHAGAADALQLDPRFDSGFSGARLAAQMAEVAGLPVVTHTFGELGVATAAVMQLHAAYPNFILDNQTYYWNLTDDVIEGGLMPFDGKYLTVPSAPGIGVSIDRERVKYYADYYEREVKDKGMLSDKADDDDYYHRTYLLRPRS
jgi:L-alanine-DL-glutamate epimerase-like enolase superfamily enzyme